jgi:hypothetical protein
MCATHRHREASCLGLMAKLDLHLDLVASRRDADPRVGRRLISWSELYNAPVGDAVSVVYERNDPHLPASEGKIAPVSINDKRPGPRLVRWLQRIDVRVAGGTPRPSSAELIRETRRQ